MKPDMAMAHRIARAIVWSDIRDSYMLCTRDHIHPPALWTMTDLARLIAEQRDRILRAPELYPADQFCLSFGDGTEDQPGGGTP